MNYFVYNSIYMKLFHPEKIIYRFKNTKIFILLVLVVIFSLFYLFLDDSHFSGVNFIKETIKEDLSGLEMEDIFGHFGPQGSQGENDDDGWN